MKRLISITALLMVGLVIAASVGRAAVPQLINYQGFLRDDIPPKNPVNGTFDFTFTIYDALTGGDTVWTETQTGIEVTVGNFTVLLGSVSELLDTDFNDSSRYLGIVVGTDPEITPRTRLVTVPYAFRAKHADTATVALSTANGGWIDDGSVVRLEMASDFVGIGTATPGEKLHVEGGRLLMGTSHYSRNSLHPGDIIFDNGTAVDLPGLKFYYGNNKNFGIDLFDDGGGGLRFTENLDETPANTRMIIKEGGNVGIGILTPSERLEVTGNIRASGTIQSGSSIIIDGVNDKITASSGTIDFDDENLLTTGTTEVGGFKLSTGAGNGLILTSDDSGIGTWQNPSNIDPNFANLYRKYIKGNGTMVWLTAPADKSIYITGFHCAFAGANQVIFSINGSTVFNLFSSTNWSSGGGAPIHILPGESLEGVSSNGDSYVTFTGYKF